MAEPTTNKLDWLQFKLIIKTNLFSNDLLMNILHPTQLCVDKYAVNWFVSASINNFFSKQFWIFLCSRFELGLISPFFLVASFLLKYSKLYQYDGLCIWMPEFWNPSKPVNYCFADMGQCEKFIGKPEFLYAETVS